MAMAAFDLAERLQTPVFVMSDLDLGMNIWMSDPFPYPETPIDRGKVLDQEAHRAHRRVGPLQGRGRRRHPVPLAARHRRAAVLRARLGPQRPRPVQRARRRLRAEHGAAQAQVRHGEGPRARSPRSTAWMARASASSPTAPATGRCSRAATSCATRRARDLVPAPAGLSVPRERCRLHRGARPCLRRRAEPRRADAGAAPHGLPGGDQRRSCAACCTTTACRSTRAASPTRSWRRKARRSAASPRRCPDGSRVHARQA